MHRRGFSLASILLLTAVIAIFMAALVTVSDHRRAGGNQDLAVACAAAGLIVGLLTGAVVGYNQVRQARGTLLGMSVGMVCGGAAGAFLAVPRSLLPIVIGSVVLVLFGVVVRLNSGSPPK